MRMKQKHHLYTGFELQNNDHLNELQFLYIFKVHKHIKTECWHTSYSHKIQ